MAVTRELAPEVEEIGRPLIQKHHRHLVDHNVRVDFAFRNDTPKKGRKDQWGECKKVGGLAAYLAGAVTEDDDSPNGMFVIEISKPVWGGLSRKRKEALVDHCLCHAWAEKVEREGRGGEWISEIRLSVRPHDLEEFGEIVQRHGIWRKDLEGFANEIDRARAQLTLPFVATDIEPEALAELQEFLQRHVESALGEGYRCLILPCEGIRRPALEITGMGMIEPGDVQEDGELRQLLTATEPGTAEDAQEHEAQRFLQDVADEVMEPDPAQHPPALTVVEGSGAPRSRKKAAEEIVTPNPEGFLEHKQAKREANLAGAAGA